MATLSLHMSESPTRGPEEVTKRPTTALGTTQGQEMDRVLVFPLQK